jgi:hypothetical protein
MHMHPDITRLREGLPAQPLTDAALARWRSRADVAAAVAALARFDAGAALENVPALARLFTDRGAAADWAGGLIAPLAQTLAAEPLAQVPLGHANAPGVARLRLASHGRAGLTLVAYARRGRAVPVSALFEDGAAHDIIIAGAGTALVHRHDGARLTSREVALAPGARLKRSGVNDARQIIAVTGPLVMLQLSREAARPLPSREIAVADGQIIKTISGCKQASQQMMALAVLGALGHAGAVPVMAGLARDQTAERDLRWEALRQCLAMDARAGLGVLDALADDQDDTLSAPAAALQQQLRERHPDLAPFVAEPA